MLVGSVHNGLQHPRWSGTLVAALSECKHSSHPRLTGTMNPALTIPCGW